MKTIRIGSGAGYGGDRLEPALGHPQRLCRAGMAYAQG